MAFIYAILILLIISGIGTITYIIYYNALQDCKVKIDEAESMIDEALRSKYDILLKLESLIKTNIKETKINFKDLNDLKKESISNFQLERKLVDTVLLINKIQDDNDDNKFVLNLKDDSLVEKGVVKRSLYDLVSLTLDGFVDSKEISFKVENEEMMVEGLLDPEVYEVSSYIYNQVQL